MTAMHISVSTQIHAPRDQVFAIYANYSNWPKIFPTIKGVRLVREQDNGKLLEIDHLEGLVPNLLRLRPPDTIEVDEVKRRYTATFLNTFETTPDGTRYTVTGDIHLRRWYKLAAPFVGGYIRRQIANFVLAPIKHAAESSNTDLR
jgi:hypothetical protein